MKHGATQWKAKVKGAWRRVYFTIRLGFPDFYVRYAGGMIQVEFDLEKWRSC